jgi:hypothetical protein
MCEDVRENRRRRANSSKAIARATKTLVLQLFGVRGRQCSATMTKRKGGRDCFLLPKGEPFQPTVSTCDTREARAPLWGRAEGCGQGPRAARSLTLAQVLCSTPQSFPPLSAARTYRASGAETAMKVQNTARMKHFFEGVSLRCMEQISSMT